MRRAYWCVKCVEKGVIPARKFITGGEPAPKCRDHGTMVQQANKSYFKGLPVGEKNVKAAV